MSEDIRILRTLPDISRSEEQSVSVHHFFTVWVAVEGSPRVVRLWTNLPTEGSETLDQRAIDMKPVTELAGKKTVYLANLEAPTIGRWWFTIEADGVWAGDYGKNGYLVALPPERETIPVWTFDNKDDVMIVAKGAFRIQTHMYGLVHAGVTDGEGVWLATYDVPLEETSEGVWEAMLLDADIDIFTFHWPGGWEERDYHIERPHRCVAA